LSVPRKKQRRVDPAGTFESEKIIGVDNSSISPFRLFDLTALIRQTGRTESCGKGRPCAVPTERNKGFDVRLGGYRLDT
jgi:hypothetical protein